MRGVQGSDETLHLGVRKACWDVGRGWSVVYGDTSGQTTIELAGLSGPCENAYVSGSGEDICQ